MRARGTVRISRKFLIKCLDYCLMYVYFSYCNFTINYAWNIASISRHTIVFLGFVAVSCVNFSGYD